MSNNNIKDVPCSAIKTTKDHFIIIIIIINILLLL